MQLAGGTDLDGVYSRHASPGAMSSVDTDDRERRVLSTRTTGSDGFWQHGRPGGRQWCKIYEQSNQSVGILPDSM